MGVVCSLILCGHGHSDTADEVGPLVVTFP